jgi:hypothetical protein
VINRTTRAIASVAERRAAAMLFAATCAAWTGPAAAAVDFSASASVGVEYNSNPIELSAIEAPFFASGGLSDLDDISESAGVGIGLKFGGGGPLQSQLQGSFSHSRSERFDKLGHSDYSVGGNVDWRLGETTSMSLMGGQIRSPVRQADVGGERTVQKTSSTAAGTIRFLATPHLQVALSPSWSGADLPLANAPDFRFRQVSGSVAVGFLSTGPLVPGVDFTETRSRNSGIAGASRYRTRNMSGTLNYRIGGFSTLSLSLGRAERKTEANALTASRSEAGVSGSLSYQRQLSPKTSFNVNAFRSYQQYDAGANLSVDTGMSVGANWAATPRLGVAVSSQATWSRIDGLVTNIPSSVPVARRDLMRVFSVDLAYTTTRRLAVGLHVQRRVRASEDWLAQFGATSVGLNLTAKFD